MKKSTGLLLAILVLVVAGVWYVMDQQDTGRGRSGDSGTGYDSDTGGYDSDPDYPETDQDDGYGGQSQDSGIETSTFFVSGEYIETPECGSAVFNQRYREYGNWLNEVIDDANAFYVDESRARDWTYSRPTFRITQIECNRVGDVPEGPYYLNSQSTVFIDDLWLFPVFYRYGGVTTAFVVAHELGHHSAISSGRYAPDPGAEELKTDCYAGAYVRSLILRDAIPNDALYDLENFLGLIGDGATQGRWMDMPGYHGTVLMRIGAYRMGVEGGVDECRFGQNQSVMITGFSWSDGAFPSGEPAVKLTVDLETIDIQGQVVEVNMFIFNADGSYALDIYGNYLQWSQTVTPPFQRTEFTGVYSLFPLEIIPEGSYYGVVQVVVDGEVIAEEQTGGFTVNH